MKYTIAVAALLGLYTVSGQEDPVTNTDDDPVVATESTFTEDADLEAQIDAKHAAVCSNTVMETAAEDKIKSKSQIEVAKNLIVVSENLLQAEREKLPIAVGELRAYELTLDSDELTAAKDAYNDALANQEGPKQSHDAWVEMTAARMETVEATYKTYDSYKQLLEAQKKNLEQFEDRRPVLIAKDEIEPTDTTKSDLAINEYNIQKATDQINKLGLQVGEAKVAYEKAGQIYQDSDEERARAENELALAQKSLEETRATLTELTTGTYREVAETLKEKQKAVEDIREQIDKLMRDNKAAYLKQVLSEQKLESSTKAFIIASEGCASLGGTEDPAALAQQIADERARTADIIKILEEEDEEYNKSVLEGRTDFPCAEVTTYKGVELTRPVRPACVAGYCCGGAINEAGVQIETCQSIGTTKVVYRPMRPANATTRQPNQNLDFTCIEGANKLALSVVAVASAVFAMS